MKKLILAAFALTTAASVFAQGTIWFQDRILSTPSQTTHIWGPSTTAPALSLIGLGSNDNPAGTNIDFAIRGMSLIGASGSGGHYGYATTFAQLIGANGSNNLEASLLPVGTTTTFRTGVALGSVAAFIDTLTGSPAITADGAFAQFEIVAWDNSSGNYATWTQASTAWRGGIIAAGHSAQFTVSSIGGTLPTPFLNNMESQTSFNLYFIPEPSTFALAGLGAAALLIFRRRK